MSLWQGPWLHAEVWRACLLSLAVASCRPATPAVGGELAFVDGDGPEARAHVLTLATGELRALAPAPSYPYARLPSGEWLLTVENDVAIAGPDGLRRLGPSPARDWHPHLDPTGSRVLFESDRDAFRELYVIGVDGLALRRLTHHPLGNFDGRWSPDGERICFSSSRQGQLDLYVGRLDDWRPQRWTAHSGDAVKCAFAPDAGGVAYLSGRDGEDGLFYATGPGQTRKLMDGVRSFDWHPERTELVVVHTAEAGTVVSRLSLDGSVQRVTPPGAIDVAAHWGPTGEHIAIVRTRGRTTGVLAQWERGPALQLHSNAQVWRPIWRVSEKP